jgi:hypothetical protein
MHQTLAGGTGQRVTSFPAFAGDLIIFYGFSVS